MHVRCVEFTVSLEVRYNVLVVFERYMQMVFEVRFNIKLRPFHVAGSSFQCD